MASTPNQRNFRSFAHMPIFLDDEIHSQPKNSPDSHGLQALQGYGSAVKAPSTFSPQNPTLAAEQPVFESLNLNSVEEEDEFLYGDSNSLPEAPVRRTENQIETITSKPESGWSDEEDFYVEAVVSKKEVANPQNPYVWNAQSSAQTHISQKSNLEKLGTPSSSNIGLNRLLVEKNLPSSQRSVSALKGDLQVSIQNSSNTGNVILTGKAESKSKYHVAAEILKKQAIDRNKSKAKEGSTSVPGFEATQKRTVVLPKNLKKVINPVSLTIAKSQAGDLRRPAKDFFESDLDDINKHVPEVSRKPSSVLDDYTQDLKSYELSKGISSFHNFTSMYESSSKRHDSHSPSFDSPRFSRHHSRSPSFGSSRYSRHRSRSPPYGSRNRSPHIRSRYRSPSFDAMSPHEYKRDRYSKSPSRRSRERSPGYHKNRSRSKSPRYFSKKHKPLNANNEKLSKMPEKVSRMEAISKSNTDVSLNNPANRSDSVGSNNMKERNVILKNKTSQPSEKLKEPNNKAIKSDKSKNSLSVSKPISVLSSNDPPTTAEEIDSNVLKNLNDEEKKIFTMFSEIDTMNFMTELMRMQQPSSKLEEPIQTAVGSFSSDDLQVNEYSMPNKSASSIPYPQAFPFNPANPPMPPGFPPMATYPNLPPSVGMFFPPVVNQPVNIYPQAVEVKPVKKGFRPTTLRSIPMSDTVTHLNDRDPGKVTSVSSQKKIESSPVKIKEPSEVGEMSSFNAEKDGTKNEKKSEKPLTAAQVRSMQNKTAIMECYKKLKAKRNTAHNKVNKALSDVIEMRQLIEETYSKKNIPSSEKAIHDKCKTILSGSIDFMNKCTKEAKHIDEELNSLKERMTPQLLEEAAKLKPQDFTKDPETTVSGNFILFDPGKHSCYSCNSRFKMIPDLLSHLLSSEHQKNVDSDEKEWVEEFRIKPPPGDEQIKSGTLEPIQGIEFMKPTTGFFCMLCKAHCFDIKDAEMHLKRNDHLIEYKTYVKQNPLYDRKCLVKRLVKYSDFSKAKAKKEKVETESKSAKRKKNNDEVDEKAKKIKKNESCKAFKVEELEEEESICIETKSSKNSEIKLNLSDEKEKSQNEGKKPSKDSKSMQRVVYIGKAPNFKGVKPSKPWYKRDTFSEAKEDSCTSSGDIVEKLKEKISTSKQETSLSTSDSKEHSKPKHLQDENNGDEARKNLILTKEKAKDSEDIKIINNQSNKSQTFVGPLPESDSISNEARNTSPKSDRKDSKIKINNPAINQALTNILYGTDSSSRPHVSLSEISLPQMPNASSKSPAKTLSSKASNVKVIPMDISPVKAEVYRPRTEEEKDFFILGINKDDMKPLAIPVPPPIINYYPDSCSITPSVPPMHILSSIPPPGYDRNISSVPYIPTNIPPPGYNVNAMNVSPHKISSGNLGMQGASTFPTNIPPPGYNAVPLHPPRVLLPTPLPSVSVSPNVSNLTPQISKKKIPANPNLITISPSDKVSPPRSKVVAKSVSPAVSKISEKGKSSTSIADKKVTQTSDPKSSEKTSKDGLDNLSTYPSSTTNSKDPETKGDKTPIVSTQSEIGKSSEVDSSKMQSAEKAVEYEKIIGDTEAPKDINLNEILETLKADVVAAREGRKVENLQSKCNETKNESEGKLKEEVTTNQKISKSTKVDSSERQSDAKAMTCEKSNVDIKAHKAEELNEDHEIPNPEVSATCEHPKIESLLSKNETASKTKRVLKKESAVDEQSFGSESKNMEIDGENLSGTLETGDAVSKNDNSLEETEVSVEEKFQNTDKQNFENQATCVSKNGVQDSADARQESKTDVTEDAQKNVHDVNRKSSNSSVDNAESVFNYQAFERLEALTQNSPEGVSANKPVDEDSKGSLADQLAPPILLLESVSESESPNSKEVEVESFTSEISDSNHCMPPVLEVEVFKSTESDLEPLDASKQSEDISAPYLNSDSSTAIELEKDAGSGILDLSSLDGKQESSVEPLLNVGVKSDGSSHTCTHTETSVDQSFDVNILSSGDKEEKMDIDPPFEGNISANKNQVIKVDDSSKAQAEDISEVLDVNLELQKEKEAERNSSLEANINIESQGDQTQNSEENENLSSEPQNENAYDSDTETDEYDNEES